MASAREAAPAALVVSGRMILLHPLFLDQVGAVVADVERAKRKDPAAHQRRNCSKRLAAILKLAFEAIPHDPASPAYVQGKTLGSAHAHWRRAKFFQQYRLFFRYDKASKIIIGSSVNDETTKRAYGSRTDAYAVFSKMLSNGHPPDNWASLKAECDPEEARRASAEEVAVVEQIMGARRV